MVEAGPIDCIVATRRRIASDVALIEVRPEASTPLPGWEPGAHIDLVLPSGKTRQYSLCGDPRDTGSYQIAVLRNARGAGGSVEVHEHLVAGTKVRIIGPRNHFQLQGTSSYVFIAGGIGITPILPMIASAERAGVQWRLYYGGRSRDSMAFADELLRYGSHRVDIVPQDAAGLLDIAAACADLTASTQIYCCGPEGLLRAVDAECRNLGMTGSLHFERFGPTGTVTATRAGDRAFNVTLARLGLTITVPGDRSILDSILDVRPATPAGCRKGFCGACETRVIAGAIEHRDEILSFDERSSQSTMMICVSRAACSDLVLDL